MIREPYQYTSWIQLLLDNQILAHNPLKPHHIKQTLYGDVYLMPSILDTNTETDD